MSFLAPNLKGKKFSQNTLGGIWDALCVWIFFYFDRQKNKHNFFAFKDILPMGKPCHLPARDGESSGYKKNQPECCCCNVRGSFPAKQTSLGNIRWMKKVSYYWHIVAMRQHDRNVQYKYTANGDEGWNRNEKSSQKWGRRYLEAHVLHVTKSWRELL